MENEQVVVCRTCGRPERPPRPIVGSEGPDYSVCPRQWAEPGAGMEKNYPHFMACLEIGINVRDQGPVKLFALFSVYKDPDDWSHLGLVSVHLTQVGADAVALHRFRSYRAQPHANQWESTRIAEQAEEARCQVELPKILRIDDDKHISDEVLSSYEYATQEIYAS